MKPQVARDRKKLKLNAEVAELRQRTQSRFYPSALNAFYLDFGRFYSLVHE
jgi:hypothetical protein